MAIIGRAVDLKRAGSTFKGCCPFHEEKTPSFDVNPQRGTFKCFGCEASGDVFGFIMKAEGMAFPDAVRSLAAEVGVELEEQRRGAGGGRGRPGGRSSTPSRPQPQPRSSSSASSSEEPKRQEGADVRDIGEAKGARVVCRYDYRDQRGRLIYQVERLLPKTFRQRRPHPTQGGSWVYTMKADKRSGLGAQPTVLYRIPELAAALAAEDPIWITEGEKDADSLFAAREVATCNTAGAGRWRKELATPFKGYRGAVKIVRDRDEAGEAHARQVFDSLAEVLDEAARLVILEPSSGKDVSDHLGAGLSVHDLVQVWPIPENLITEDPKRFKQLMLRRALEVPDQALAWTERHEDYKPQPQPPYATGLKNLNRPLNFQGCVVVSGAPSAAKSYLATGCGIDNAIAGWDVFLLKCEMAETVQRDRAARAVASHDLRHFDAAAVQAAADDLKRHVPPLPDRFHIVNVNIGVTIEDVVGWLADHVTERPTLVILDSISSFIDNMAVNANDAFGMAQLREVTRYTTGVSELTHGHVAWLLLSEINKESRPKGRGLDHRCDIALSMVSSEEEGQERLKDIRITKNWHGTTGHLGTFVHWWQIARLARMDDPPR